MRNDEEVTYFGVKNLNNAQKAERLRYLNEYRRGKEYKLQREVWLKKNANYYKKWKENHPDYFKIWRAKNKESYQQYQKNWRIQNSERKRIYMRNYMRKYRRTTRLKLKNHAEN